MAKQPEYRPWLPVQVDGNEAKISALQALHAMEATPEQQRLALTFIIETVAGTYEMSHQPENPHDTSFAEGKRFVGNQLIKFVKLNLSALRKKDGRSRPDSSRDPDRSPAESQRDAGTDS